MLSPPRLPALWGGLMQVREGVQATPVLARQGVENSGFCMQSHAA